MDFITIDELYSLFEKEKQIHHFSAKDSTKALGVQMSGKAFLEDRPETGFGVTPFRCYAYHDHVNLNKSNISSDLFKDKLGTLTCKPVLAHVIVDPETGMLDFGGHSMVLENEGTDYERIRYLEQPVGMITRSDRMVYDPIDQVNRAYVEGVLFSNYCPDVVTIIESCEERTVDVSIELFVNEIEYDPETHVMNFLDYDVSGVTLLGRTQKPGMKGSKLTLQDFEENPVLESKDVEMTKGGKEMEEIEVSVHEEEAPVTEEESLPSESDAIEEEAPVVEENVEMAEAEDNTEAEENPEIVVESDDDVVKKLHALVDELAQRMQTTAKFVEYDSEHVIWMDEQTSVVYQQAYSEEDGNFSLADLAVEISGPDESKDLAQLKEEYSVLEAERDMLKEQLAVYQKKEEDTLKNQVLYNEEYVPYLECDAFVELLQKKENFTLDEFKVQAELAFVQAIRQTGKLEESPAPKRFNLRDPKVTKTRGRYGNLLKMANDK